MTVKFTGPIKDLFQKEEISISGTSDLADLREKLQGINPEINKISYRISVNGVVSERSINIADTDELILLTLLQGG